MPHSEGWPEDGSQMDFEQLVEPVKKALRAAYTLRRQPKETIEWTGPMYGREASSCGNPKIALSKEWLLHDEEQGRDALDTIIGIAIRLGMEQGRRGLINDRIPFLSTRIWSEINKSLHDSINKVVEETFDIGVPSNESNED